LLSVTEVYVNQEDSWQVKQWRGKVNLEWEFKYGVCTFCRRWTCLFLFLFTVPMEYKPSSYQVTRIFKTLEQKIVILILSHSFYNWLFYILQFYC